MKFDGQARDLPRFCNIDFIVVASMVVVAFAIRLYFLPNYDVISNDGTAYVRIAREIRIGNFGGVAGYGFYPVFIWLAGFFTPDLELAGRMVSVISGALLCIPVYFLGKELFSRRTAFAACLAVMVWPSLRHWSCEVMTQSSYIALSYAGIYCLLRMMRRASLVSGFLAGLFLGLAYVTRTEAILICILTPLPLIYEFRQELRSRIPAFLGYFAVFVMIVGANLLLVRSATGSWQLASKTSVALNDAISYVKNIPDMNYIPGVEPTSYFDILRTYPSFIAVNTLKNLAELGKTLVPPVFWIFLLAGLASGGLNREKNLMRAFLVSTCTPLAVIVVYYYVGPEYTQPYIPVVLLFCAEGLRVVENFAFSRLPPRFLNPKITKWEQYNPITVVTAALFAIMTLYSQIPDSSAKKAYLPESDGGRRDQKNIGLVIKNNLPPGKIMTRWSRIAFYSEREWMNIPNAGYNEIITAAREGGAKYLIVDGGLWAIRPELGVELFEPFKPGAFKNGIFFNNNSNAIIKPGLKPFMVYINDPTSMGAAVYEIN